jgi:hypothetical protein
MKNEPGIRPSRHRLSRLEIMPSHHAVNILQQKETFSLLLNRAGDGVPRLEGTCLFEMEARNDGSFFVPAHSTGVSGCVVVGRNSPMKSADSLEGWRRGLLSPYDSIQACLKQGREQRQWILEVNWKCRQLERILEPKAGP